LVLLLLLQLQHLSCYPQALHAATTLQGLAWLLLLLVRKLQTLSHPLTLHLLLRLHSSQHQFGQLAD
jgi:hypothetical protein